MMYQLIINELREEKKPSDQYNGTYMEVNTTRRLEVTVTEREFQAIKKACLEVM